MSSDPVVIYLAASLQQAHLLQEALARVEIEAWVESPADNHLGYAAASGSPRVVVRREDADEARQMAEEFDELLRLPPTGPDDDSENQSMVESASAAASSESAGEVIDAWPQCPECQTPRNAECTTCKAAADFFPPAFQQSGERNGLRMCPTCDDVFKPRFFRHCHECGHDFGNGLEPMALPPAEDERRAWALLWAMLALMLLLGGYFSWLFRR